MRKALIAVAVATALFAVGAFAANFAVNSEDIASGENDVVACAERVDVDFDDPTLNTSTGAWTVAGATVKFLDGASAATSACNGFDAELALDLGATLAAANYSSVGTGSVSGSTADINFAATDVATIHGASVVIDGATLFVDPTP